ncbi:MAG: hypothetical protein Kow0065_22730 [Methylomicrobium sp.]
MAKNYYRILGLADNAEDVVVRAAFKLLAHRYHPDKWPEDKDRANRMMSEINRAYQHLPKQSHFARTSSDPYRVLGVLPSDDAQLIHAAYAALIKKYRYSSKKLAEINDAYGVLLDGSVRKCSGVEDALLSSVGLQRARFSLWKIYLLYNVVFYVVMGSIILMALL